MKNLLPLLFALLLAFPLAGQEKKFDIEFHGFVGFDAMRDSRVSQSARHNHILLYPLSKKPDANGKDLNDRSEFDMGGLISRFNIQVKGPTVNGITTFAMIEGDMTAGTAGADGEFLTRHAYMQLGYNKFSLLAGQTWHPFFIPENFPQTLNAGVGVPIHPLSRNAQIRLTYKPTDKLELSASVIEQGAFRSAVPKDIPLKGTEEAAIPEVALQLKAGGTGSIWGSLTAGYKTLAIPYTVEPNLSPSTFGSYHLSASMRFKTKYVIARAGTIYGGNLTEHAMIGGVGKLASSTLTNPEYAAQYTHSLWLDLGTTSKTWDPGLFVGSITNLGGSEDMTINTSLGRGSDIVNILMIVPRLRYQIGTHVWVGIENIFSQAGYGAGFTSKGKPKDLKYYRNPA
jgi:hypothetical protein